MTTPRSTTPAGATPPGRDRFGLSNSGRRPVNSFGVVGTIAGAVLIALVVGGIVWSAATGKAPASQRPHIFGGSLVLDDYRPLTVIDLATGEVTVQLEGVYAQVGATNYSDVQAVPTAEGTTLVNRKTGTFNMLGNDDYVLGPSDNGISLGPLAGASTASGFADGSSTYIVRYGPTSTVSLVDPATAVAGAEALASRSAHPARPLGFAHLTSGLAHLPGGAAVDDGDLWALASAGQNCQLVEVTPTPLHLEGLTATRRSSWPTACAASAVESESGTVGVVMPGRVELFGPHDAVKKISDPATSQASAFLPVEGNAGELWYLVRLPAGWSVLGVGPSGQVTYPVTLPKFGPGAEPAVPAFSAGKLFTLDQAQPGQPTLWAIDPVTGVMEPVHGAPRYPAKSVTEKASFHGAEVLVDGPRVIFNNPESLLAVVVFTDGSHAPVIVDKSNAVVVSATGPGDVNVKPLKTKRTLQPAPNTPTTTVTTVAPPITQPVTQQANCAASTEKPYAPQVSSITPSDESALVAWSYHLLSEQDCLPRTWSVTVSALGGAPQPVRPTQVINGQQQLLFTGLRPGTNYQAVVTAYINSQATGSEAQDFATTAHGPGAPANVTTRANGQGGWLVSWSPCRGPNCFAPAVSWTVVGSSCGTAFVGQPPVLTEPASRTSVTVNPGNNLRLLGSQLTFSVEGVGNTGLPGAPTADHTCTQAWQPPDAAAMQLLAAATPVGQSVTASLQVVPSGGTALAYGGDKVTFLYSVGGHTVGPTTATQVTIPGLSAAKSYVPAVLVTPVGHPSAAVTVTGRAFSKTVPWPAALRAQASGVVGANPNAGSVVVTFPGLPAGPFKGSGTVTCGSEVLRISGPLANGQLSTTMNLDEMGGRCFVSLTLEDTLVPDPYGLPSDRLSAPFSIGSPQSYSFHVTLGKRCARPCTSVEYDVNYQGAGEPAGMDWQVSAKAAKKGCTLTLPQVPVANFPTKFAWPTSCSTPTVLVSWVYLGEPASASSSPAVLPVPTTSTTSTTTRKTTATTSKTTKSTTSSPNTTTTTTATTRTSATTETSRPAPTTTTTACTGRAGPHPCASTTTTASPTSTSSACAHGSGAGCPTTTSPPTTVAPTSSTSPTTATTSVPETTSAPTTTTLAPTTTATSPPPTTTSTTVPPTTQPTTPTTTPTTSVTTTTAPVTTTTVPTTTTTTSPTTTTASTTTSTTSATTTTSTTAATASGAPAEPSGAALVALGRKSPGGPGGPDGPGGAWPALDLWFAFGGLAGAVCAGSLAWGLSRRPKARLGVYGATEVTT